MEGELGKGESSADKAKLKKEADRCFFVNRVMCRITSSESTYITMRVCVPSSFQDELMTMYHANP